MSKQTTTYCDEQAVLIDVSVFDDLLSYQAKHLQVLGEMIRALELINADVDDQRLVDVSTMLEALAVGSSGVVQELIRVAQVKTLGRTPSVDTFKTTR